MKEAERLAHECADMVNSMDNSNKCKELVDTLLSEHRTLQQSFFSDVVIRLIREVAMRDRRCFDGRNQAMKEICDKLYHTLSDNFCTAGLPFI